MREKLIAGLVVVAGCMATSSRLEAFDAAAYRIVDLGHAYDEQTLYWPSRPAAHFELEKLAYGETPAGFFYASNRFCTAEHGGTHLDAPIHFARDRHTVDQLPLTQLIAPAVRIDIRERTANDRSYQLQVADVERFEKEHGAIPAGSIVLLQTGWSRHWPNREQYLGSASAEDASGLDFPSYGEEAARLLVRERKVAMLGVDTASIDYGKSKDFIVHRIAAQADVGGLENLTNLDALPETGFNVIALPVKIRGGSGGPVRVVALIAK